MSGPLVYLDNAATSWPKPEAVYVAVDQALREHGGNPGRASHRLAVAAQRIVEDARQDVRRLFNAPSAERVIFTLNCTDSLCLVLKGLVRPGDRVVTGPFEHNSVVRPLHALAHSGALVTACRATADAGLDLDDFRRLCRQGVHYVVLAHASNVTGRTVPVAEVARIAHEHGALLILDAAQTAGSLPIDLQALGVDVLACSGHKGLCGPMGTGALVFSEALPVMPWREGGNGVASEREEFPREYPGRMEAGTCNLPGIAGLAAGVRFVEREGVDVIGAREVALARTLAESLRAIGGVRVVGAPPVPETGVVSFVIEGVDVALAAAVLDQRYGIALRGGLHCAPAAHRALGTLPEGTLRASFGPFNREADPGLLAVAVRDMAALRTL